MSALEPATDQQQQLEVETDNDEALAQEDDAMQ